MATIRKRNGKYQALVRRADSKPSYRTFLKKSDALEWARMIEHKADRGDLPQISQREVKNYTLKDIIVRYRDEISIKKRSHNTEIYILNAFLRQSFVKLNLQAITPKIIASYRDERLKKVKEGTVRRELSILKHALDIARMEWGIPIANNPVTSLRKLKTANARNRRLSITEENQLYETTKTCRNPHIVPIIQFALETAMRRGEILSLQWQDISLDRKLLHIPITKNGHARTIPLSSKAIEILKSQKSYDNPFPVTTDSFKMAWKRLIKRSGIDDLHFHDFRHEAISRLFEKGLSIPEVALISGHRDYRMLFRYTHLKPEDIVKKL